MVKRKQPSLNPIVLPVILVFLYALSSSTTSAAANLVSGSYGSAGGTNIVLNLSIKSPSPSNLIVEQYISPGNKITGTSPPAKKINAAQGKVKWLFRNIRSGSLSLSIKLGSPLKGSARAMIRYRDPNSGQFSELTITP